MSKDLYKKQSTRESHPSFGKIQINRIQTSKAKPLFGSSISHNNTIRISIHPAYRERSLYEDTEYAVGTKFIEVELSNAQFAEAITNMNSGGTPVTITQINNEGIEQPEIHNKRQQFEQEFKETMSKISANIKQMTERSEEILTAKKAPNKTEREEILNEISKLHREIASTLPFIASSYNEQLDKTTHEAKSEVEAFTAQHIKNLGLQAYAAQLEQANNLLDAPETNNPTNTMVTPDD